VPFGGPENKILHFDPVFPKTPIFRQFSMGLQKFLVKKALTMGMLMCKLPLIVIIAIIAGRGGLVVGRTTAMRADPGSNLTTAGCVCRDSHCNIQPWARVVHSYCSA